MANLPKGHRTYNPHAPAKCQPTFYKLIAEDTDTGEWRSSNVRGEFMLKYRPGKITEAPGIGVMCFDTMKHVNDFHFWARNSIGRIKWRRHLKDGCMRFKYYRYRIIEVSPRSPEIKPRVYNNIPTTYNIRQYLNSLKNLKEGNGRYRKHENYTLKPPFNGTLCFKKVKVLGNPIDPYKSGY